MSARNFVDTNNLVYAHDVSAGVKHQRARALDERSSPRIGLNREDESDVAAAERVRQPF